MLSQQFIQIVRLSRLIGDLIDGHLGDVRYQPLN